PGRVVEPREDRQARQEGVQDYRDGGDRTGDDHRGPPSPREEPSLREDPSHDAQAGYQRDPDPLLQPRRVQAARRSPPLVDQGPACVFRRQRHRSRYHAEGAEDPPDRVLWLAVREEESESADDERVSDRVTLEPELARQLRDVPREGEEDDGA